MALHPLFPDRIRIWKCCAIEKNRKDWSRLICRLTLGYSNLSMFARVSCLSKPEKSKFTTRNTVIRALRMTTISKRWPRVRHWRLVWRAFPVNIQTNLIYNTSITFLCHICFIFFLYLFFCLYIFFFIFLPINLYIRV